MEKKKLVFLTGSGISKESGIPTFRDAADGLWENYDISTVCTHDAWLKNYWHVNQFYNYLRTRWKDAAPNDAHRLVAELQGDYDVTVITQNVDNLHEAAGSQKVIHLHGEIMKCCSSKNPEDQGSWVTLPQPGFGESGLEIPEDTLAADGSLLRPYIVFFEEPVPRIKEAIKEVSEADILVVIGTSMTVYPAAGLVEYLPAKSPLYIIDPGSPGFRGEATHIKEPASIGMKKLTEILLPVSSGS